jgi:hypothetical protein
MFINISVKTESLTLRRLIVLNKWAKGVKGVKPEKNRSKEGLLQILLCITGYQNRAVNIKI